MKEYETFGQALAKLMQMKGYTVKDLTEQMHIKSSNTIARLLAEKSSPNKIKAFYDDLLQINPLQLVANEKERLREAVEVSTVGPDIYAANKHMLYFVKERPQSTSCICKQAFGTGSFFISTLDELMQSYANFKTVSIVLQNCALSGITRALRALLEQDNAGTVTIEHYVSSQENRAQEVRSFINLLDVMGHPNYSFFFSPYRSGGQQGFHNVYNNIMIVLKCDERGNKFTDLITFHEQDSFTVLYNMQGEESYQFHRYQFQALRLQHNPAKVMKTNSFDIGGMLNFSQNLMELDVSRPLVSIRPDISLCMVPPDILRSALEQLYENEMDKEQEKYQDYLDIIDRRYNNFKNPCKCQQYLFSKSGLYYFATQGKSKANVFGLRDLTLEERLRVLNGILEVAKSDNPLITFHLLKNELRYNDTSYWLYGNDVLLIDNYPGFRNYDAMQNYNSCRVRAPFITESFVYFVNNDLLPNYTYSHEETIAFLESLL